jgi:signal transduction histidine kinase
MALRHVKVPPGMEPVFARAEQLVAAYFAERRDDPARGTIDVRGERYVLVRAKSLSVEFFTLVRDMLGPDRHAEADAFSRDILFDLAHAIGRSDAQHFIAEMGVTDPLESMSSGPIHFAWTGWASVDIHPHSRPEPGPGFVLHYDHPESFEATSWIDDGRSASGPTCTMNAGYSSGWCTAAFGIELVSVEVACRACGDDHCRFVMAPPDRIEDHVSAGARNGSWKPRVPDFFARQRAEEELRTSRDALDARVRQRTRELEETNLRLLEEIAQRERLEGLLLQANKLEALGRLAGGLAHDFNNLLGVVSGHAELVHRAGDPAAVARHVEEILSACDRGAAITRQLTSFSKREPTLATPVDLGELVADHAAFLAPLVGEDIELALDADEGIVVLADRGQLDQVLLNLVTNAKQAMPRGGTLTVEAVAVEVAEDAIRGLKPGAYGVLRVSDTGHGMDEDTALHAFDPFFTTRPNAGGTGLGLSMVYGTAAQHGGLATLWSTPGAGTTVSVLLPRSDLTPADSPLEAPEASAEVRAQSVLIVEDENDLREILTAALRAWGLKVHEAAGPTQALALVEQPIPIDIILTDVVMPIMNGRELSVRLLARRPDAKVVFMSGYPDDELLQRGIEQRDVAFLRKPFRLAELRSVLFSVLDG